MPVTKKLMAAGDFSIRLRSDTPPSILDQVGVLSAGFASVFVTPAWQSDPANASRASSIYTGVLRKQTQRVELAGAHASIWLGDEDQKSDFHVGVTANQGMVAWVTEILSWTPLTAGTVTAPTGTWLAWTWPGGFGEEVSPRDALDYVCAFYSTEWRVTDDLDLDVATRSTLYGGPLAIFSRRWSGRDYGYRSVRAVMTLTEDLEDYSTRVVVVWDNAGTPTGTGVTGPATPYNDPTGADLVLKRKIESSDTKSSTAATAIATREASRWATIRQSVSLATDHRAIMFDLRCGESVYLWDPEQSIYDTANQITFRGHVLFPLISRVVGLTMPVEKGMGVYIQSGASTPVDVTPYVEWESPGAEIEVGDFAPSLARAMARRGLTRRN